MSSAEVQLDDNSNAKIDLGEVQKVLRHAVLELGRIIRAMEANDVNQRNIRQARDFALKASVAKATEAAPAHRQLCPDGTSHK